MVLQCFSKLSLSEEIFTGKGASRQPKLYLYWEALQKKDKQPNCGSRLFCSPKTSQLSKVSQQFCRRLLILQIKINGTRIFRTGFDDGSIRYQI